MTVRRVMLRTGGFAALLVASVALGRDAWPAMELVMVPPLLLLLWWTARAGRGLVRGVAAAFAATSVLLIGLAVTDAVVVHDVEDASSVTFGRPFPWISQDVRSRSIAEDLPARVGPFAFGSIDDPRILYRALAGSAAVVLAVVSSLGAGGYLIRRRSPTVEVEFGEGS